MAGKAGRPKAADPVKIEQVGLRVSQWDWVRKWRESDASVTECVREWLDRAEKFWPDGPNTVGRVIKHSRERAPAALKVYADRNGLTLSEAKARIAKRFFAEHPEEVG